MKNLKPAPIVLFTYCRPYHTQQTVEALLRNKEASETDIIIYSDAPKNEKAKENVLKTRQYLHSIKGFKNIKIIERKTNYGLAKNLTDGITSVVNEYGKVIVIEDDIVTAPHFLKYMNEALDMYEKNLQVASIHGYVYPTDRKLPETFFIQGADCWGWATWKRAWDTFDSNASELLKQITDRKLQKQFDFDYTFPYIDMLKAQIRGNINSWAICWYASAFLNNMYTLYPCQSMVQQIGMDGVGATHSTKTNLYQIELCPRPIQLKKIENISNSPDGYKSFQEFFLKTLSRKAKIKRLILLLKSKL